MSCGVSERFVSRTALDFGNYAELHQDGRELIQGWFKQATEPSEDKFEPFIYLWIAFNAWSACVTSQDRDGDWQRALGADDRMCDTFHRLAEGGETRTAAATARFAALWPIFKVQELRDLRIGYWSHDGRPRSEIARSYVDAGAHLFEPRCYYEHEGSPPLDWPHSLAALVRVRNNLFHGEKARSSENDRAIIGAAHEVLLAFVSEAELLA